MDTPGLMKSLFSELFKRNPGRVLKLFDDYLGVISEGLGKDFQGKIIDVRDPKAKVFWDLARKAANDEQYVHSILDLSDVFPSNLSGNQLFREEVLNAYKNLISSGSLGAIKELLLFSE